MDYFVFTQTIKDDKLNKAYGAFFGKSVLLRKSKDNKTVAQFTDLSTFTTFEFTFEEFSYMLKNAGPLLEMLGKMEGVSIIYFKFSDFSAISFLFSVI